jgi:hypothetical protein
LFRALFIYRWSLKGLLVSPSRDVGQFNQRRSRTDDSCQKERSKQESINRKKVGAREPPENGAP